MTKSASGAAVRATRVGEDTRQRVDLIRWLLFNLVCAGGSLGLAWLGPVAPLPAPVRGVGMILAVLVLPLATLLVPVLLLRRVPRKKRKVAWQLCVPLIAGVAMGVFGNAAGDQAALADRGRWTDAVVVSMDDSGTNHCDLRTTDGRTISPSLPEGGGCEDWVSKGDELRVRYDPEGIAGPTEDQGASSYGGMLAALFLVAVLMGTWGSVRQSEWDRRYDGR
ncbi:hypothetical protein [Streptomyces griseomycini]|uniref:DUF3592 domain-containing protein n=1 Tax=Streptomyces griseomycini TaxID=66895 RepID=A0A7W7LXU4_9ACTN|nr:hypothetical protein [Streptomyces griseomycini]MBB4897736.1 hypothetical protein [Streptomyces griseomycini]GGQ20410.1 hypothetical protein GCM10010266_49430 [Streptomyces griseomycini]GGR11733.1 hypothetical protein GCM10015536_16560 [Streptomyces griseomycini]